MLLVRDLSLHEDGLKPTGRKFFLASLQLGAAVGFAAATGALAGGGGGGGGGGKKNKAGAADLCRRDCWNLGRPRSTPFLPKTNQDKEDDCSDRRQKYSRPSPSERRRRPGDLRF